MAVTAVIDATRTGAYQEVYDLAAGAADPDGNSAAINHGLGVIPTEWKVVDTTALGANNHTAWVIHTLTTTQFTVWRCRAAANGSTSAKLFLRRAHTMGTGRTAW